MKHKPIFYAWIPVAMLLIALGASTASAQEKGIGFNDAVITERVKTALNNDPLLRKTDIAIETRSRVVHLSGFVDSVVQVDRAGALARAVEGVSRVRNTIRVTDRPSRA